MSEKLFDIQDASGGYGGKIIISGLSLTLERGTFAAIIGPNGAGKSTLLKMMTGQLPLAGGKILFSGKPLGEYPPRERARRISFVEQSLENILSYSVNSFVSLGLFPHRGFFPFGSSDENKKVAGALKECGISHLRERRIDCLSGGELQMASIARSLVQNRDIIFLDEPVSHLDIRHSVEVMDLLYGLNKQGATIISVLHDINMASDYCSRILALKKGALFFDGHPGEVINYSDIEELFECVCIVRDNPITGSLFTYPVPGYIRNKKGGDS